MSEWKEVRLGDILQEKGYVRGPFGSALKRGEMISSGIPVYEQQHAIYNSREFRFFISKNKYKEMERFSVFTNDIIISCSGTVGFVSKIKEEDPKGIISQALLLLRVNPYLILPDYLCYFFKTKIGHNSILERSSGSVQVNIAKRSVIEDIRLYLPPIKIQENIVAILSALDDKIAVNRRICENLEAQAQALFKHWFIDFAPFKDGKFVESELGMIPEGWRVGTLTQIADYLNGLAMQKFPPKSDDDAIPVLKIKELGQACCDSNSDKCTKQIKPEYVIKDGDVVFSWSGTLLVDIWCGGICGLNQHLFKVTSEAFHKWFYLMWTKYHLAEFIRIAKDKAVTMGHIKRGDLEKALVTIPNKEALNSMNELMDKLINEIINTRLESSRLATLRDTLLPKLMSGQIKV